MKKILLTLVMAAVSLTALSQEELKNAEKKTKDVQPELYRFTDQIRLESTPVRDQYRTGTCWSFAGIGTLETDLLQQGKDFDLSEMWVVRNVYYLKAVRYVRMHGNATFSEGGLTADVMRAIKEFGIVPEEAYPGLNYGTTQHVHAELSKALTAYVNAIISNPNRKLSTAWKEGLNKILDAYFGERPEKFIYDGVEYTPHSFLKMTGINVDDYVSITSYTHHPFYARFILEIPDNWGWNKFYNVPMDEMTAIIDNALANGYAVGWDADVSETGFRHSKGVAILPVSEGKDVTGLSRTIGAQEKTQTSSSLPKEIEVTQEYRQETFDNYLTTDDHLMVITGTAVDQNGTKYYIVKNSWDDSNLYGGYVYCSLPYVQAKTIGIIVNKNGLPSGIKQKLDIK